MNSSASSSESTSDPVSFESKQKIEHLLNQAIQTYEQGKYAAAFNAVSNAKAFRLPVKNIDYFRAACLLHLGRPIDAREALREELHYFPTNSSASQLLEEVLQVAPDSKTVLDPDFSELYTLVKPHTMVPEARLYSLFSLARKVCIEDLPGNFVECGVSRGGATFMMAMAIKKYSKRPRLLFGFDTFEGMPDPTEHDMQNGVFANDTGWGSGTCGASLSSVQELADQFELSDIITLVRGYFENTLGLWVKEVGEIALLHLDADWYTSTITILDNFYDNVIPGGYLQFDDYGNWEGCQKAVDEFQLNYNISFDLNSIVGDNQGIWVRKP